jgi:hypothetical protein
MEEAIVEVHGTRNKNTGVLHMQDAVVLLCSDATSERTGDEKEARQRRRLTTDAEKIKEREDIWRPVCKG